MAEVESTPGGETPPEATPAVSFDFSDIRGFQAPASSLRPDEASARNEEWRAALRLEFESRAARLHEAVDGALVLANDGAIRWLGDPVAKMVEGTDLYAPHVAILADDNLSDAGRQQASKRIELWLVAQIQRLLGPLVALAALEEGPPAVVSLAKDLARGLGVLEREPIKSRVKSLDQEARAALRKHGVRFGSYYVYLPALLKPAARSLALHLWGRREASGQASGLAEALAPVAHSGRTSAPADPAISRDSYRVAGFRVCCERVVRVDIVERLADLIRAAMVARPTNGGGSASFAGFVATPQMTSLVGCSGDQFASILRALGYESALVERSLFAAADPAKESATQAAVSTPAEAEPATIAAVTPAEGPQEASAEAVPATIAAETPSEGPQEAPAEAEPATIAAETQSAEPQEASADKVVGAPSQTAANGASDVDDGVEGAAEESAAVAAATETAPASEVLPDATPASPAAENAAEDKIVVWRLAPRARAPSVDKRRRHWPKKPAQTPRSTPAAAQAAEAGAEAKSEAHAAEEPGPRGEGGKRQERSDGKKSHHRPRHRGERFGGQPRVEAGPPHRGEEPERKAHEARAAKRGPAPAPKPPPSVDPNSPFAKLLEIRALLVSQNPKRS